MEVDWLLGKEVGSETLVGVEEDSVHIIIELSGDILGEELNLIDQVTTLGSLGGGSLSALSVVGSNSLVDISWVNSGNVEAGSESVGAVVWALEKIVE